MAFLILDILDNEFTGRRYEKEKIDPGFLHDERER
jgi:hypothetical protein